MWSKQKKSYWCPNGCGKKVLFQEYYVDKLGKIKGILGMTNKEAYTIYSINDFGWKYGGWGFVCNKCHQKYNSKKEVKEWKY